MMGEAVQINRQLQLQCDKSMSGWVLMPDLGSEEERKTFQRGLHVNCVLYDK